MKLIKKIASSVFSPIPVSRDRAIGISERLAALTSISSSLEYLHQHKNMDKGGLNDWEVMRQTPESTVPALQKVAEVVSGKKTTVALHAARVAVGTTLLLPGNSKWRGIGNLFLGASTVVLQGRHRYGTDGSDQVCIQVQAATGAARLANDTRVKDALMWYIALQANMSYAASGLVKLTGDKWRDGSALPGVMRTRTYGFSTAYELTQRYPRLSKATQHGVLAMECLFPLVYLAGGRLTRPFVAAAGSFHLANAFVMGLGRFATSFPSMHPILAYTTTPKDHPAVAGRDDRLLKTSLVLLAAGVTAMTVSARQRRAKVLAGWPLSDTMTTRYGNELMYDLGGKRTEGRPVLVFVHSLAATSEHFAWILERLAFDLGYPVVAYSRAGYAASKRNRTAPYTVQESVDELEDLIRASVAEEDKIVLIGHSMGGELMRRVAPQVAEKLAGMVYLDPSHPAELQRSSKQQKGQEFFTNSMAEIAFYAKMGFGPLMSRPKWVEKLPESYREKVFALYSDGRTWEAAVREWEATQEDFKAFEGDLDPVDAPALLLAAQRTVDIDPEQLLMYNELVRAHQQAGHEQSELRVIDKADHDSILTDARFARTAADLAAQFIAEHCLDAAAHRTSENTGRVPASEHRSGDK